MIQKTIGITVLLLALWSWGISRLPAELETGQTLRGANLIRAETYLYETAVGPEDLALVGSSLSEKLSLTEVGGRKVLNLGFGGQSAMDGLDLLLAGPRLPGVVFVETNILQPGSNSSLGSSLFNPLGNWARSRFPAVRHRHQPVGVIKGLVFGQQQRLPEAGATASLQDRPLNQQSLALKVKEYAKVPSAAVLSEGLETLRERVNQLEQSGVRVVFYEAPIHPSLCQAPRAVALREGFRKVFSPQEYAYIAQPDCAAFQTTDGHHLGEQSIRKYADWLAEEMEALLQE